VALFPPLDASPDEIRAALAPLRNDFSVAVFARSPFAVGAVIRVAHSFLAREIIVVGRERYYEKASMGMERYETVTPVDDEAGLLRHVGERPVWAVERERATVAITAVRAFPRDVVFVLGAEHEGVPEAILARAEATVGIPMYGVNHSLPVVVAAGIVMHEWARRRYAEGLLV
jgi:tRNA G18 (ribose-2'-O)-methylase SpoU